MTVFLSSPEREIQQFDLVPERYGSELAVPNR